MSTSPKVPPPPPPKPTTAQNGNKNGHHSNSSQYGSHNSLDRHNGSGSPSLHLAVSQQEEQVVMTPRGKTATSTIILVERKLVERIDERVHVAGGDHTGIIINKDAVKDQKSQLQPAQLQLEFRVFLVSGNTGLHSQESRTLRFWFRDWLTDTDQQAHVAQDFFRELVSPKEFPRDYVGFIKKIMKQMQKGYNEIQALEIELRILEKTSAPPSRPLSFEDDQLEVVPLTPEKVLELIEQAYPNPINPDDLANDNGWSTEEVLVILLSLQNRGLIKSMEFNSFTRIHHEDTEIRVVKQMPTIASNKQPTIAIITAQYCEKLAVDAMLENKETFVRYTTVGESNVYTLGNIGAHRIVSTKLPSVGSTREALTAAGNTTTRLLGTFQKTDYVFLVGVAGGVPHYTDFKKHVRLGDVVVSAVDSQKSLENASPISPVPSKPYVYVYNDGQEIKTYNPKNPCLQEIARYIQQSQKRPWQEYMKDGLAQLQGRTDNDFQRPSGNTDKLYMNIGNGDVIEVAHPQSAEAESDQTDGMPVSRVHLGPIGSGSGQVRSDSLRNEFSKKFNLLATDIEMSSVLDSVIGNCKESFILVRGIADYKDGWSTKKWQNYSSLAAAAVMKSIVCAMDPPTNV